MKDPTEAELAALLNSPCEPVAAYARAELRRRGEALLKEMTRPVEYGNFTE